MKEVSFTGGWNVKKDDNSGYYEAPHWWHSCNPTIDRRYPYLYNQGQTLQVSRVLWNIPLGIDTSQPILIQGITSGGLSIAPASATYDSVNNWIIATNLSAMNSFTANVTAYYNTFNFDWFMSDDGGVTWIPAGTSDNEIFVTLSDPDTAGVVPYRTVAHLACSSAGATNADQAVANTWALFAGLNVCKWNQKTPTSGDYDKPLYYYKPGTDPSTIDNPTSVVELLHIGSGQCLAWRDLLQQALLLNGAYTTKISVEQIPLSPYAAFWINSWGNLPDSGIFYFQNLQGPLELSMKPYPSNNPYGCYVEIGSSSTNFNNQQTVSGQNSNYPNAGPVPPFPITPNAPSQKIFGSHAILEYEGTYFDPSYGLTYPDATYFQNMAIAGFGYEIAPTLTQTRYQFDLASTLSLLYVGFLPE